MIDSKDDIFTIEKCADFLMVSTRTIYDLVSDERIPGKIFAKKVGRSWRILRSEIERFLSEEKGSSYQMKINQNIKK